MGQSLHPENRHTQPRQGSGRTGIAPQRVACQGSFWDVAQEDVGWGQAGWNTAASMEMSVGRNFQGPHISPALQSQACLLASWAKYECFPSSMLCLPPLTAEQGQKLLAGISSRERDGLPMMTLPEEKL